VKLKFLADADLNALIVDGVIRRRPAIDFRRHPDIDLEGKSDLQVLQLAADMDRLLVSHDFRTMPAAFGEFISEHTSPGVLLVPQHLAIGEAIDDLLLFWELENAADWISRIGFLPI